MRFTQSTRASKPARANVRQLHSRTRTRCWSAACKALLLLQVQARLWVRNGPTMTAHALHYRSPAGCMDTGLDHDLLLLRLWAATAPGAVEVTGCAVSL